MERGPNTLPMQFACPIVGIMLVLGFARVGPWLKKFCHYLNAFTDRIDRFWFAGFHVHD